MTRDQPITASFQGQGNATCTHETERRTWVPEEEYTLGHIEPAHWHYETVGTYEDIDLGRYRCTQCNEVFYYTGLWRRHWEGGRKLLDERTGCIKGEAA